MEKITYLCNTTPSLSKLRRNLPLILPYVDRAVICIGQRNSVAEAYCKSFDKVSLVYFPWEDSFKEAYQCCFDHAPKEGWHLRLDDDEVPSPGMLRSLKELVEKSNFGKTFDVVEFECFTANLSKPDYYPEASGFREVFYRWGPELHYQIDLHQSLVGLSGPKFTSTSSSSIYYHVKSEIEITGAACRNFFIAGVWADRADSFTYWHNTTGQDPRRFPNSEFLPMRNGIAYPLCTGFRIDAWYEMKSILEKNHPSVRLYRDLDSLIRSGQVCPEFRSWAHRHNEVNDNRPHLHELHCFDKYLKEFEKGSVIPAGSTSKV